MRTDKLNVFQYVQFSVKNVTLTKASYFTNLGRSRSWTDLHRNLRSSCRPRHDHVCKVLNWNVQGLGFYRGSNFPFPITLTYASQQSSANALPVTVIIIYCAMTVTYLIPAA